MPETKGAPRTFSGVWPFLAIVFPLSWALWVPVVLDKTNPVFLNLGGGPALSAMWVAAARDGNAKNRARPIAFALLVPACWLVVTLNGAVNFSPPAPLRFNPALLVPSALSAWIISGAFSSDRGIRSLLRSMAVPSDWRWPLAALPLVPSFVLATAFLGRALGLPVINPAPGLTAAQLSGLTAIRFFHYLLFTAIFEEPGWRGFLLPRLQARFSPLMASVLVWVPWAVWHLPLDLTRPGWGLRAIVQQRVVILLLYSVWITWLYNRARGGLLSAVIFHGGTGSFVYLLPSSPLLILPLGALLVLAFVIADRMWRRRPELGQFHLT